LDEITGIDIIPFLRMHPEAAIRVSINGHHVKVDDVYYDHRIGAQIVEIDAELPRIELWSAGDVVEYLKVSRQRVHQLASQYALTPAYIVSIGGGRHLHLWHAATWRQFAEIDRGNGRPKTRSR
jgi:hypothetical protein